MASLEGWSFTTKLHPLSEKRTFISMNAGGIIAFAGFLSMKEVRLSHFFLLSCMGEHKER